MHDDVLGIALSLCLEGWCIVNDAYMQAFDLRACMFHWLSLMQDDSQRDLLIPMQERVAAVKPFWETLPQEGRTKILAVSVTELKQRAAELAEKQRKQAGDFLKRGNIVCKGHQGLLISCKIIFWLLTIT